MATGKKTGGRQKGSRNRVPVARAAAVAASGLAPLDYMLAVLRDGSADQKDRMWAAEKAAPYVHPRLAAIEHTGKDGAPLQIVISAADAEL